MLAEGLAASHNIIYVDTVTPRVSIGTLTYTGGVPNTALWVSSNVVISSGPTGGNNNIVIYSTGSICWGANGTCQTAAAESSGGLSDGSWISFSSGTFTAISTLTIAGLQSQMDIWCKLTFTFTSPTANLNVYAVMNQRGVAVFPTHTPYGVEGLMTVNAVVNSQTSGGGLGGIKYLPLGPEATEGCNGNTDRPVMVDFKLFSVVGASTSYKGHATQACITSTPNPLWANVALTINHGPSGVSAGLEDIEIFMAAANEGGGNALMTGRYRCWKATP